MGSSHVIDSCCLIHFIGLEKLESFHTSTITTTTISLIYLGIIEIINSNTSIKLNISNHICNENVLIYVCEPKFLLIGSVESNV